MRHPNEDMRHPNKDLIHPNKYMRHPNKDMRHPNEDARHPGIRTKVYMTHPGTKSDNRRMRPTESARKECNFLFHAAPLSVPRGAALCSAPRRRRATTLGCSVAAESGPMPNHGWPPVKPSPDQCRTKPRFAPGKTEPKPQFVPGKTGSKPFRFAPGKTESKPCLYSSTMWVSKG